MDGAWPMVPIPTVHGWQVRQIRRTANPRSPVDLVVFIPVLTAVLDAPDFESGVFFKPPDYPP